MTLFRGIAALFKAIESNVHPGVDPKPSNDKAVEPADIADTGDNNGEKDSTHS